MGSVSDWRLVVSRSTAKFVENLGNIRMVRAKTDLVDSEGAAVKGLGLGHAVRDSQELRQVVEAYGDGWMGGARAALVDSEGAAAQRLGLGQAVGVMQKQRQVVEVPSDVRMSRASLPSPNRGRCS